MIIKEILINGPEVQGKAHLCYDNDKVRIDFHDIHVEPGAPDVHIALSTKEADAVDPDCTDIGTYTYDESEFSVDIPKGVDVDKFSTVIFYCKEFNSFGGYGVI